MENRTENQLRLTVNVPEAAQMIGVCSKTMYNLIHSKGFPVVWFGRKPLIPIEGLQEWLRQQTAKGMEGKA